MGVRQNYSPSRHLSHSERFGLEASRLRWWRSSSFKTVCLPNSNRTLSPQSKFTATAAFQPTPFAPTFLPGLAIFSTKTLSSATLTRFGTQITSKIFGSSARQRPKVGYYTCMSRNDRASKTSAISGSMPSRKVTSWSDSRRTRSDCLPSRSMIRPRSSTLRWWLSNYWRNMATNSRPSARKSGRFLLLR